jgi:hypothetical protein
MKAVQVESAKHIEGYKLEIHFSDHSIKVVDFSTFLNSNQHPVYNQYKNLRSFKRFRVESGNVVWGKDWDLIFPVSQLYQGKVRS